MIAGDSVSVGFCHETQNVLDDYRLKLDDSRYSADAMKLIMDCKAYQHSVIICCIWAGFSSHEKENYNSNLTLLFQCTLSFFVIRKIILATKCIYL